MAYPDHLRLSFKAFDALGEVPALVATRWCIDPRRIYFAGHSDGGSSAAAVTFRRTSALAPAALWISGAGLRGADLAAYQCPLPLPVTVVHGLHDERFAPVSYGRSVADWWARCNQCSANARPTGIKGCVAYDGCAAGAATVFCASDTRHADWPNMNAALLSAFAR